MNRTQRNKGVTMRVVIGTLCAVAFVPAMILMSNFASYKKIHAQQDRARIVQKRLAADPHIPLGAPAGVGHDPAKVSGPVAVNESRWLHRRPVYETSYEEVQRQVVVPVVDGETGKTVYSTRNEVVRVPVVTTRYVTGVTHGKEVMTLVQKLRESDEEDEGREEGLANLKELLQKEFDAQHTRQGEEIKRTAERLETLKEMHAQRETNKERIVQRRIDELLGEPDPLRWQPGGAADGSPLNASRPLLNQGKVSTFSRTPIGLPGPPVLRNSEQLPQAQAAVAAVTTQAPGVRVTTPGNSKSTIGFARSGVPNIAISSGSNDVFELARRLSSARLSVLTTTDRHAVMKQLHDRKAITSSEYRQSQIKLEQAKQDLALATAEWEAMSKRLKRELDFAKSRYDLAKQQHASTSEVVDQGQLPQARLYESEDSMIDAIKTFEDSQAKLKQFEEAIRLIEGIDKLEIEEEQEIHGEAAPKG